MHSLFGNIIHFSYAKQIFSETMSNICYDISENFFTFLECDYALQLGKDFIPLMMEKNFKPDGWLGIFLGTKLYTEFIDENLFEHKMKDLCSRLRNVCNTVEPTVSPTCEPGLTSGTVGIDDPFYGKFLSVRFCFVLFSHIGIVHIFYRNKVLAILGLRIAEV